MSAEFNDIFLQGYLKVKSKNIGTWNKRWVILKKASSKGPIRLEKYQDERTASIQKDDSKAVHLCDVKSVSRLPSDVKKHAFAIMFCDKSSRQFACDSELEADKWQHLLETECTKANQPAPRRTSLQQNGQEKFNVYLIPSPQLDIFGECLLHVSAEHLILYDITDTQRKLVSWPLTTLRRYGKDDSKFTIESGRFCETGEGMFLFNTSEAPKIYQKVHSASVAISQAHRLVNKPTNEQSFTNVPPLVRGTSEQSPPPYSHHSPLQISHSYPQTGDSRAPLPLPRDSPAPPVPERPQRSVDQNMPTDNNNTFPSGGTFQVSYSRYGGPKPAASNHNNNTDTTTLSSSPSTTVTGDGTAGNTEQQYIYEEKYLSPQFRKFLSVRKGEDEED